MEKKKTVVATASLAGCFGCHMSILDIDERILSLIDLVEFHRSPITDIKHFTEYCDIGIIEGSCCNSENVQVLREFRRHCRVLVSLGECAIMGGVPAMRNGIPVRECIEEAYLNGPSVKGHNPEMVLPNDPELPMLLDRVYPCHEIVKVDHFLPGCPPRADLIYDTLSALITGGELRLSYETVKYD